MNDIRDLALPPKSKEPENIVLRGTQQPRKRRRRRTWLGWLGFPSREDAAFHARMIMEHLLSLIGWRA